MKRIVCFFIGHKWKRFGVNQSKVAGLGHLHSQAGMIEVCTRCKTLWDDFLWGLDAADPGAIAYYHSARERAKEFVETSK